MGSNIGPCPSIKLLYFDGLTSLKTFDLITFGVVVRWKLPQLISSFFQARTLSLLIFNMSVTEDLHFKKPFKEPSQFQVSLVESVSMQANECLMEWYVKIYQFTIFKSWKAVTPFISKISNFSICIFKRSFFLIFDVKISRFTLIQKPGEKLHIFSRPLALWLSPKVFLR